MKKGGTFFLIGLTLMFFGFTIGMVFGRTYNQNHVTVQVPTIQSAAGQDDPTGSTSVSRPNPGTASQKVNINTASAELLDSLPGIGPVLAQRIVAYRESVGLFGNVSELTNVEGIGEEKLLAIIDLITVED